MKILEAVNWVVVNGNRFAQSYAECALHMWADWSVDARRTQVLYILSNMSGNRRPNAAEARAVLKAYVEETK